MTYSTDARFYALITAQTALVRALVLSGSLDSAIFQDAAVNGRARMQSLGADRQAVAAYDDLMRSLLGALE
jgi:hypothetical protein